MNLIKLKGIIMKSLLLTIAFTLSTASFASGCESAAESAAIKKFTNIEFACHGRATVLEKLNAHTMRVLVDSIGGFQSCTKKTYDVTFKDSGRTCSILEVKQVGGLSGI